MDKARQTVRTLILLVIGITIVWSFVNVSMYARLYHDSWVVYSFGFVVAVANALSVYRVVEAQTKAERVPAITGVVLFGGMSGVLQTMYYGHEGADIVTSVIFGWFGPVAEAVLSWLLVTVNAGHTSAISATVQAAAVVVQDKPRQPRTKPVDKPAEVMDRAPDIVQPEPDKAADIPPVTVDKTADKKASRHNRIVQLHGEGVTDPKQLSELLSVSIKTIQRDIEALNLDSRTNGVH